MFCWDGSVPQPSNRQDPSSIENTSHRLDRGYCIHVVHDLTPFRNYCGWDIIRLGFIQDFAPYYPGRDRSRCFWSIRVGHSKRADDSIESIRIPHSNICIFRNIHTWNGSSHQIALNTVDSVESQCISGVLVPICAQSQPPWRLS